MKIYPSIDANGNIGEVRPDSPGRSYKKTKLKQVSYSISERSIDYVEVEYETYTPTARTFMLSENKLARVTIYVSDDLKDVNEHIEKNAPWLFTYATRHVYDE